MPGARPPPWLMLGKTRLVLAAQRSAVQAGPRGCTGAGCVRLANASLQETQIRMVVHDESNALFDALDANADGRLGEREIATAAAQVARGDANGDGALTGDEAPYEMIVAFVRGEPWASGRSLRRRRWRCGRRDGAAVVRVRRPQPRRRCEPARVRWLGRAVRGARRRRRRFHRARGSRGPASN